MILVDTSVWVDHLRVKDKVLVDLLERGEVLGHPFVTGEIALGHLRQRRLVLDALAELPQSTVASDDEVLSFIERKSLSGLGIGYVDAHLLAATALSPAATFWTRDKRLHAVARGLGLATP
jgi:predicted nucleic acid-binding protein